MKTILFAVISVIGVLPTFNAANGSEILDVRPIARNCCRPSIRRPPRPACCCRLMYSRPRPTSGAQACAGQPRPTRILQTTAADAKLTTAGGQNWYRLDIETLPQDWGGTDGYITVLLEGANRDIQLTLPGIHRGSFEQRARDVFYFSLPEASPLGRLRRLTVWIKSSARNQVDNWTYRIGLSGWSGGWVDLGHTGVEHSFARDDHSPWTARSINVSAVCHASPAGRATLEPPTAFPFPIECAR